MPTELILQTGWLSWWQAGLVRPRVGPHATSGEEEKEIDKKRRASFLEGEHQLAQAHVRRLSFGVPLFRRARFCFALLQHHQT